MTEVLHLSKSLCYTCYAVFDDRYMRNDLNRLQIRCVNAGQGCEMVCSLENLHTHEDECEFAFISCSNTGMMSQLMLHFKCQLMFLLLIIISLNGYSCGCVGHKGNVTPLYVCEQQMAVCCHGYITN